MHRQLEDDGPGFGRDIDTDVALFGVLHYRQLEKWLLLKIVAVRDHSDQVHVKEPQSYTKFTAMVTDILEDLGVVASNFNALPQHLLVSGKIHVGACCPQLPVGWASCVSRRGESVSCVCFRCFFPRLALGFLYACAVGVISAVGFWTLRL